MSWRERGMNAVVAVAVTCAVISTVILVRREFPSRKPSGEGRTPVPVAEPAQYLTGGHRFGAENAALTVVEFVDFECPFCRVVATGPMRYLLQRHPDLAVIIRQRPMPYHRFALPAARAAECAATQGRYREFHDALFAGQDSLGLKTFGDFARGVGVPDLAAFAACNAATTPIAGIDADIRAAERAGVQGTPAFIIGGMLMTGVVDSLALDRYVTEALQRHVAGAK